MTLTAPMRCAALAEALDERMIGSVDHRVRWLLVEDRSAWGEKAVRDVLGPELEAAARARGMRLLLVRRRDDDPPPMSFGARSWSTRPPAAWSSAP